VTLAGQSHVSRVGVSLLTTIALPDLIAQTPEQYIQTAADLAANVPRLAELRSTLRGRMRHSALMTADRFARAVESAYRTMWRTWCRT
jgi:predicted O-linked N-acetylglucosamine transferase (SPINDLY family)